MMDLNYEHQLQLHNLQILGRVGRGSNSHVFKIQSIKNKKLYALKVIDKNNHFSQELTRREINVHRQLNHQNILRLVKDIEDNDNHYILTEYCPDGQATRLLKQNISLEMLAKFIVQICKGLKYMHDNGYGHCDLKLSNILLNGSSIKLCDFGYSMSIHQNDGKVAGTLLYMSPQILIHQKRDYIIQADVWALGIIILTLLLRKQPYAAQNSENLKQSIISNNIILPTNIPQSLSQLLLYILQPNPCDRITIDLIMRHHFITSYLSYSKIVVINNNSHSLHSNRFQHSKTPLKKRKIITNNSNNSQTTIKKTQDINNLPKINTICLKQQSYQTRSNSQIIIDDKQNMIVYIKNKRVQICSDGSKMKIIKGDKYNQVTYEQLIKMNHQNKNKMLYQYIYGIIDIIKKKQIKWEIIDGNDRYWLTKNNIFYGYVNGQLLQDYQFYSDSKRESQILPQEDLCKIKAKQYHQKQQSVIRFQKMKNKILKKNLMS